MKTATELKGRLVRLRPKRAEDAALDYQWHRDPELSALHAKEPLKLSWEDFQREFKIAYGSKTDSHLHFSIDNERGEYIGECACHRIDRQNSEGEIGISINRADLRRRGYGSDAMKTLINHLFNEVKLDRLTLKTLSANAPAQACFKRLGFVPTGYQEKGSYRFLTMELERKNWVSA